LGDKKRFAFARCAWIVKPTLIRLQKAHLRGSRITTRELAASRGVRDLHEGKALKAEPQER